MLLEEKVMTGRRGAPAKYNWPGMIQLLCDMPVNGEPMRLEEIRAMLGSPPVAVVREVIRRTRIAVCPEAELAYIGPAGYVLVTDKADLARYRNRNLDRTVAALDATVRTQRTLTRQYRGSNGASAKQERGMAALFGGLLDTIKATQEAIESNDFGL